LLLLLLGYCSTPMGLLAQLVPGAKFHKVKILLEGKSTSPLSEAGLEVDHGLLSPGRWLVNDYSEEEVLLIKKLGFGCEILQEDVSAWYARQDRPSELGDALRPENGGCEGFSPTFYPYPTPIQYKPGSMGGYFTYKEMLDILDTMAARYPHLISKRNVIEGFTTVKGNSIFYVTLSDSIISDQSQKPKVLYTALHHAREPNSLSQMLFYMWYLLENYGRDPIVDRILQKTELYFVPCINPDGYIQNQSTNPNGGGMWRKNLWADGSGNLKGVDLNRNYGYFWGNDNAGSSSNPNSQTFRGLSAFSEPETQAIRQLCLKVPFAIAINYHTFGNYLIHPWGYNDEVTAEDAVFKSIGRVMNSENNFLMGTAQETVGYQVNGVSDDWMYGEKGEKAPIYAFTPEAGPSFWPPSGDIDQLNKSCVWMNLSAALLTLSYYSTKERDISKYLSPDFQKIAIQVNRAGLKDGACTVTLQAVSDGVIVRNGVREVRLVAGETQNLWFEIDVDGSMSHEEGIRFLLITDNEGLLTSKEIVKQWLSEPLRTVYRNGVNTSDAFVTTSWQLTPSCYSPPFAMTDSEPGTYKSKETAFIALKKPLDLSLASKALLTFYARWDIESQYDYAQVAASTDSIDFIPLCGKYTKAGGSYQDFNSPVFDGTQTEWVKEEADLSWFAGEKKVWIRFSLTSDEYAEKDGFYFDELEVLSDAPVSASEDLGKPQATLFPTVVRPGSQLYLHGVGPGHRTYIDIFSIQGQWLHSLPIVHTDVSLSSAGLPAGVYLYRLKDGGQLLGAGKLVLLP
jgi:carboxypeptidase T